MKQIVFPMAACLVLAASPAFPQDEQEGQSLMEKGAELFWEGLRNEMSPTFDELRGLADELGPSLEAFMAEMGPAVAEIMKQVEDWTAYEAPEMLPNGDIIIRRKQAGEDPEAEPDAKDDKAIDI